MSRFWHTSVTYVREENNIFQLQLESYHLTLHSIDTHAGDITMNFDLPSQTAPQQQATSTVFYVTRFFPMSPHKFPANKQYAKLCY